MVKYEFIDKKKIRISPPVGHEKPADRYLSMCARKMRTYNVTFEK